jgi:hypothetical protein
MNFLYYVAGYNFASVVFENTNFGTTKYSLVGGVFFLVATFLRPSNQFNTIKPNVSML